MMVTIPSDRLSKTAFEGVVREFILREGTDYGSQEWTLEQKMEQVIELIKSGKATIVFDPETESHSII